MAYFLLIRQIQKVLIILLQKQIPNFDALLPKQFYIDLIWICFPNNISLKAVEKSKQDRVHFGVFKTRWRGFDPPVV